MVTNVHNTESTAAAEVCWSCTAQVASHFCTACGKVQPPVPVDYFTFFGLPRKLNLDVAALERDFYRLSRQLHPDLFGRADPQEQQWSLEKTSRLNDAYRTLRDPIARTEYLLKLEGVHLEEQSKAATDRARQTGEAKKQVVPPDLLEEAFEFNMQLEELRAARKTGADADPQVLRDLQTAKQNFESKLQKSSEELQTYWNQWDALAEAPNGAGPNDEERRSVRDKMVGLLNRRSYIRNLVRDVNEALEH